MPVKKIAEVINSKSIVPTVILCEHAGDLLPNYADTNLGIGSKLMSSHYAYDAGSKEVALACAENLGCTAILGIYSRLWIDLNRNEDSKDLILEKIENLNINSNNNLSPEDKEYRLNNYYRSFHALCLEHIKRIKKLSKKSPLIISIHSFTRKIKEKDKPQPWDIGLLHNKDKKTYDLFNKYLSNKHDQKLIGDNQPYNLKEFSIPSEKIAYNNNCPHIIIELCEDRIKSEKDILKWSKIITGAINHRLEN